MKKSVALNCLYDLKIKDGMVSVEDVRNAAMRFAEVLVNGLDEEKQGSVVINCVEYDEFDYAESDITGVLKFISDFFSIKGGPIEKFFKS